MDQHELLEAYKLLIVYKNNLFKVDVLLMNEEDEETIQELTNIKEELQPAIDQQEDRIR
jgi:survival-of-motor-neuron-related-splicing factor 30